MFELDSACAVKGIVGLAKVIETLGISTDSRTLWMIVFPDDIFEAVEAHEEDVNEEGCLDLGNVDREDRDGAHRAAFNACTVETDEQGRRFLNVANTMDGGQKNVDAIVSFDEAAVDPVREGRLAIL
jgi:hypothetical protein